MRRIYVIKPAKNGGWDISLISGTGEIFLTSVNCKTKTGAENGIEPVNTNSSAGGPPWAGELTTTERVPPPHGFGKRGTWN